MTPVINNDPIISLPSPSTDAPGIRAEGGSFSTLVWRIVPFNSSGSLFWSKIDTVTESVWISQSMIVLLPILPAVRPIPPHTYFVGTGICYIPSFETKQPE